MFCGLFNYDFLVVSPVQSRIPKGYVRIAQVPHVNSAFEEFNLLVYHSLRGVFFDAVIWCLGPFVDDSRDYGRFRCYLALATRHVCRTWLVGAD